MAVTKERFSVLPDKREVDKITITNSSGNYISVLNYGCILQSVVIRDCTNNMTDVVMGYDSIEDYTKAGGFIGAVVGRCANRISNGTFPLNDRTIQLYQNDGCNHLHGGREGFGKKLWDYNIEEQAVCLSYLSADGEEAYPGNLLTVVRYTFTDDNKIIWEYSCISDQDTVVNLTNHSYFNLNGFQNQDGMGQRLQVFADFYTPVDENGMVTGEIRSVSHTCFDFRTPAALKENYQDEDMQLSNVGGYDHNLVLGGFGASRSKPCAVLAGEATKIRMDLVTDSPGIQLYSGNYLRDTVGKYGIPYHKKSGICLEPQYFPNSVNISHFPSPILRKNQWKSQKTIYHFVVGNQD